MHNSNSTLTTKTTFNYRPIVLVIAWMCALLPAAIFPFYFWDDVALYYSTAVSLDRWFSTAGLGYFVPVYEVLKAVDHNTPRNISPTILILIFLAGFWAIYAVVNRLPFFSKSEAFAISIIAGVAPLNFSKPLLTPLSYNVCFTLFAFGVLAAVLYEQRGALIMRFVGLGILFLACSTASFLPIAMLVPLLMIGLEAHRRGWLISDCFKRPKDLIIMAAQRADFILLPPLAYLIRRVFLEPSGLYSGYNIVELSAFAEVPGRFFKWIGVFLGKFSYLVIDLFQTFSFEMIVFTVLIYFLLSPAFKTQSLKTNASDHRWKHVAIAALLVFVAVLPYLAVGKSAVHKDWLHRHQLVLQVVSGYVAWSVINLIIPRTWIPRILAIYTSLLVAISFFTYLSLHRDGHLQNAQVYAVWNSPELRAHSTIAVKDPLVYERVMTREMRIYEWLDPERSPDTDSKAIISIVDKKPVNLEQLGNQLKPLCQYTDKKYHHYGVSEWKPDGKVVIVRADTIQPTNKYGLLWIVKMTLMRYNSSEQYKAAISKEVELEVLENIHISDLRC